MNQQVVEIIVCMKSTNNQVPDTGSIISFRGAVALSVRQAFFLTFCAAIGLASLVLVFQIQFQDLALPGVGQPNQFFLTLIEPYSGIYYWKNGYRVDEIKVKLASNNEETLHDVIIEVNDEEILLFMNIFEDTQRFIINFF